MPKKVDKLIIFFCSIILSLIFLKFENFVGVGSDYHPDSIHYLNFKLSFSDNNFFLFLKQLYGRGFYFWVKILNYNYYYIIAFNILFFALTNVIFFSFFKKNLNEFDFKSYLLLTAVILMPYKLHLSVHVLKETIIIFLFILIIFKSNKYFKFIFFLMVLIFRKFSIVYLIVFLNIKKILLMTNLNIKKKIIIFFSTSIFIFVILNIATYHLYNSSVIEIIYSWSIKDMGGRNYDSISNFSNYGLTGVFLKAILWPIIFLSGIFVFLSFNFFYFILFLEIVFLNMFYYYKYKKILFLLEIYSTLLLITFYVSSFTAYFRYSYIAYVIFIFYQIYLNEKKK